MPAKLTVNHDYLTLRVNLATNSRVNMTINRWGVKLTATLDLQHVAEEMLDLFDKSYKRCVSKTGGGMVVGDFMALLQEKLDSAASASEVISVLKSLTTNSKSVTEAAPKAAPKAVEVDNLIAAPSKAGAFSQEELQAAFDTVKNKKNWKTRIDRTINAADAELIISAIIHFHGSVPYTLPHPSNPQKLIVRGSGYACY